MKWQYHYLQACWPRGTHYILTSTFNENFDVGALGPTGYICANGQGMAYPRIRARIQAGSALVMLQNTGGVIQAFASLHRALLSTVPPPDTLTLLSKLELVSPEAWSHTFGVTEINILKELNQRAPQLLRKTITQVDVLNDSSEEVLAMLTNCFSGSNSMPELGLGEAEILLALSGWKRHLSLWNNAQTFLFRGTVLQLALYGAGLTTTIMSVIFSENKSDMTLEQMMVILPVVTGVIGTLRSKLRYKEKGNACLMGAFSIVSEIYKYRLRAGAYDTTAVASGDDDDSDDKPKLTPKQKEQLARELCVSTIQDMYAGALQSEVSKGSALKHPEPAVLNTALADDRAKFMRSLQTHVVRNLYGEKPKKKKSMMSVSPSTAGGSDKDEEAGKGGEIDDYSSPLELEIYIAFRVRSLGGILERIAPGLARELTILEIMALLANATGGVLAVLGYAPWVAVVVAAGIIFTSMQDYWSLSSQVTATNEAASEVHSLISWWDSLSLVQRKTREARSRSAEVAEGAILKHIGAKTGMSAGGGGCACEEGDGDEGK